MAFCTQCGRQNPDDARFCAGCGTPLEPADAAPAREVRKTVTVVFCDVTGSTTLGEQLDPESLRRVMSRYFEAMSRALERHGGTVEKFIGDAVMAVFGIPVLHEDDAVRAVRAAAEMPAELAKLNRSLEQEWGVSLQARIGVNTGEVVTAESSGSQKLAVGDAVNVAARLEQAAAPGEVLIGEETYRLARDAVEVEPVAPLALKGKSMPVVAYRLTGVKAGAPGHSRRLDSPLVGRGHEKTLLSEAYARAVRERACHLFTVLGSAGVGKSRLAGEFLSEIGEETTVLSGRCLPYGEGITFWPLAEALRGATGLETGSPDEAVARIAALIQGEEGSERIADLVGQLVGLREASAPAEETSWAVRKLFEALARQRPLIVAFDDLHWAEPSFLDLVEHIADWSRDAPTLVLCLARPDLLDTRPAWAGGKLNASSVLLEPLNDEEAGALVGNLLEHADYPEPVRRRVLEVGEGVPLFLEELVAMLIDDGLLRQANGGWTASAELTEIAVPPTIQALLAARIERLGEEERALLERASVEGKVFHRGAVQELTPEAARSRISPLLMALVRKEMVRPDRPTFADEDAFRFRNLLVRDSAYRRMPKESRANLHEQFASWLEGKAGERAAEYDEIVGWHLEQAFRYEQEIGLIDAEEAKVAARAGEKLAAAGRRAFARGDMPAAANLLDRAVALLAETGEAARLDLLLELGDALRATGELARARATLDDALRAAVAGGDRRLEAHALVDGLLLSAVTDREFKSEQLLGVAEQTIGVLEEFGDEAGLAKAWRGIGEVHLTACRWGAATEAYERGLRHAERAGDPREIAVVLTHLANSLFWGPTPVEEGIRRAREILEQARGQRIVEANVLCYLGGFAAMRGDFDEAWALVARGRDVFQDLGHVYGLATHTLLWGAIGLLAGDAAAAERELRPSCELLEAMGETAILSNLAALLAEVLYVLGNHDDAERLTQTSEDAAADDDTAAHVAWRVTRAKVFAQRGHFGQAESLARQAIALVSETDFLNMQGEALLGLAEVHSLAGRGNEAVDGIREALERFERKGNVTAAKQARALLGERQPA